VGQRADVAWVAGVPVDDVTMDEAVDRIYHLVARGRVSGRSHQVATVNVDFVVNAGRDRSLRELLQRTALSIPDGMPIVWGSRLLGTPLRTRVAGADLVEALVARAADEGAVVALFGGARGVAERAATKLRETHPHARVVGLAAPLFDHVADLTMEQLAELADVRADICCVAFGNPKQERFIERFGAALGIPVLIGVGGALDFIVGEKRRAPGWMQRNGLEWLHRAATEPRRLAARYVRDAVVFGPALLSQAWRGRPAAWSPASPVSVASSGDGVVHVRAERAVDNVAAAHVAAAVREAWRDGHDALVSCSRPRGLSRIVGLDDLARASGQLSAASVAASELLTTSSRAHEATPASALAVLPA
jgi:N-acetylglucosaminyldiphosphoundecaprenol N-acetyl-beta-D-mannosaminyltransferase